MKTNGLYISSLKEYLSRIWSLQIKSWGKEIFFWNQKSEKLSLNSNMNDKWVGIIVDFMQVCSIVSHEVVTVKDNPTSVLTPVVLNVILQ